MPNDIISWLVQLHTNMVMRALNSQIKKLHFCIGNLPSHIIPEISDLAETPPASNVYKNLKKIIHTRMRLSERRKIQQLLNTETLGDCSVAGDTI